MSGSRAVFVDRDGTINELVADLQTGKPESPLRPQDVILIRGAASALKRINAAGLLLVGVSNQPAAAKGAVSREELDAVQRRVLELLAPDAVEFDAFHICPHHPDGSIPGLVRACDCRKPAPGMLLDAARELNIDLPRSWMIGDTDSDVLAGRAAGTRTILVAYEGSVHKRTENTEPDAIATSLDAAVSLLLSLDPVP